jgi:hypothetical protein
MDKRLKRPRDPIQLAKLIGDIATGQVKDRIPALCSEAITKRARKGGTRGGRARAQVLTPDRRSEIARVAANARWKKGRAKET